MFSASICQSDWASWIKFPCVKVASGNGCDPVGTAIPMFSFSHTSDGDFQSAWQPDWVQDKVGFGACHGGYGVIGALCHLLDRYEMGVQGPQLDGFCADQTLYNPNQCGYWKNGKC
jgi:hypothetical protein